MVLVVVVVVVVIVVVVVVVVVAAGKTSSRMMTSGKQDKRYLAHFQQHVTECVGDGVVSEHTEVGICEAAAFFTLPVRNSTLNTAIPRQHQSTFSSAAVTEMRPNKQTQRQT